MPVGLYILRSPPTTKGSLAVVRLPERARALAHRRAYLPADALLIKWIVATAGDIVCRTGTVITINAHRMAQAQTTDASKRPLPRWVGCIRLSASQVFVLSANPGSFDSRYFGPIAQDRVIGTARLVWTSKAWHQGRAAISLKSFGTCTSSRRCRRKPFKGAIDSDERIGKLRLE